MEDSNIIGDQSTDGGGGGGLLADPLSPKRRENGHHHHHHHQEDQDVRDLLYQQFDQLALVSRNPHHHHNNGTMVEPNQQQQPQHNDNTMVNDVVVDGVNNGGGPKSSTTNHNSNNTKTRRQRVKSFIEFDDDQDDDDDDDGEDDDGQHQDRPKRYRQRSSLTNANSITIGDDYRQDLIHVFGQENNLDGGDSLNVEEWNDFQTSPVAVVTYPPTAAINGSGGFDDDDDGGGGGGHHTADHDNPSHRQRVSSCTDADHGEEQGYNENEFNDIDDGGGGGGGSDDSDSDDDESNILYGKLNKMEQEQELLNNSLLALTSHFAQVQLRLRQIVEAKDIDAGKRETLLQELENFANRGIPDLLATTGTGISNHGTLERSQSMATSLMADDVFEDDDNDHQQNENDDVTSQTRERHQSTGDEFDDQRPTNRSSWSCYSDQQPGTRSRYHSTSLISEEKLERQRSRQKELISQLKDQLEDLERYAYETGELNALPSSMLLERQNAIIEQLKNKLPILSIDEIDRLSPDELRRKVDHAVRELVNPVLMKEQLVSQLRTQVTDLERFIEFLQESGGKKGKRPYSGSYFRRMGSFLKKNPPSAPSSATAKTHNGNCQPQQNGHHRNNHHHGNRTSKTAATSGPGQRNRGGGQHDDAQSIFKRILSLLQVFAWTQLGSCASFARNDSRVRSPSSFKQNTLKRQPSSACARHWGDLRAHLELAIGAVLDFHREHEQPEPQQSNSGNCPTAKTDGADFIALGSTALVIDNYFSYEQMTILVRKELAVALRNLIQHGLIGAQNMETGTGTVSTISVANNLGAIISLGLGCFSSQSAAAAAAAAAGGGLISSRRNFGMPRQPPMHAWELILYYYELKNGNKFRSTPTRRLTQSFGLQVVSGTQTTNPKHSLLAAIDDIIDSHTPLKRSLDSHFKAFVCTGLNQRLLSQWLRLILRHPTIVAECYEKWSYTAMTGFDDALRQLDKLSTIRFCLPTDLAVRQLQSIHDAF